MTEDEAIQMVERGLAELRAIDEEIAADHRRAAFFRRFVRTPRFLYWAHRRCLKTRWTGPWRWYHRAALAVVRWWLDRFEMLTTWGRLW